MNIEVEKEYLEYIAYRQDLVGWHYKILLAMLADGSQTTTDIANKFDRKVQNISQRIKELEDKNLIEVDREHGKNKFYKLIYRKCF